MLDLKRTSDQKCLYLNLIDKSKNTFISKPFSKDWLAEITILLHVIPEHTFPSLCILDWGVIYFLPLQRTGLFASLSQISLKKTCPSQIESIDSKA